MGVAACVGELEKREAEFLGARKSGVARWAHARPRERDRDASDDYGPGRVP